MADRVTTIAWKDGILAADRFAWLGNREAGHARKTKVHRLDDDTLVGISSSVVGAPIQLLEWIEQGYAPDDDTFARERPDHFTILLVRRAGPILYWDDGFYPQTLDPCPIAIGSGASYALGAMEAGKSAAEAVLIAARFDPFTTTAVDVLHLDKDLDDDG